MPSRRSRWRAQAALDETESRRGHGATERYRRTIRRVDQRLRAELRSARPAPPPGLLDSILGALGEERARPRPRSPERTLAWGALAATLLALVAFALARPWSADPRAEVRAPDELARGVRSHDEVAGPAQREAPGGALAPRAAVRGMFTSSGAALARSVEEPLLAEVAHLAVDARSAARALLQGLPPPLPRALDLAR